MWPTASDKAGNAAAMRSVEKAPCLTTHAFQTDMLHRFNRVSDQVVQDLLDLSFPKHRDLWSFHPLQDPGGTLEIVDDRRQGLVDLMSETGGHLPHGRKT